jgi:hypothetical protein
MAIAQRESWPSVPPLEGTRQSTGRVRMITPSVIMPSAGSLSASSPNLVQEALDDGFLHTLMHRLLTDLMATCSALLTI